MRPSSQVSVIPIRRQTRFERDIFANRARLRWRRRCHPCGSRDSMGRRFWLVVVTSDQSDPNGPEPSGEPLLTPAQLLLLVYHPSAADSLSSSRPFSPKTNDRRRWFQPQS